MNATDRSAMRRVLDTPDRGSAPCADLVAQSNTPALVQQHLRLLEVQALEEVIAPGLSTVPGLTGNHNEAILVDEVVLTTQPLEEVIAPVGVIQN